MPKINIKSLLYNVTEDKYFHNEVIGEFKDNNILFNDNEVAVEIIFNDFGLLLKRKSEEYDILLPFDINRLTKGNYLINKLGNIELNVETKKLDIKDNVIEVEYRLVFDQNNIQEFNYKIEYEEV
ncbi:MAG TPA: DUF1934 family protein [Bacilli bacterium]|nr:DUF1934 family protein [Bacilli bacterium]